MAVYKLTFADPHNGATVQRYTMHNAPKRIGRDAEAFGYMLSGDVENGHVDTVIARAIENITMPIELVHRVDYQSVIIERES